MAVESVTKLVERNLIRRLGILALTFFAFWATPSYGCHQDGLMGERCGRTISIADTGKIYFIYQSFLGDASSIIFERSDDSGATWTAPKIISSEPYGIRPAIAADKFGGVYVTWYDEEVGNVYWAYSLDEGATWSPDAVIPQVSAHNPNIAVKRKTRNSDIEVKVTTVTNADKHILYHSTLDLGANWSETRDIDEIVVGRTSIVQDRVQSAAHIVYVKEPTNQITHTSEVDNFESQTVAYENINDEPITFLTMTSPRSRIFYVIWSEGGREGLGGLRMTKSLDNGATWVSLPDVLTNGYDYSRPHLLTKWSESGTQVHVISGRRRDLGVVFLQSPDGGETWSDPIDLCPTDHGCAWPRLSFGSENELVATIGATLKLSGSNTVGPQHMFIIKSFDNGLTWTEPKRHTGSCGGKPATIIGTEGDDTIIGTFSGDVIAGLGGDDVLAGGSGDDYLCGDEGHDVCVGSMGTDTEFDCEVTLGIP